MFSSVEVADYVLSLLCYVIEGIGPLVSAVRSVNLLHEALRHHGVQDALERLPREVRLVHDPGWLGRSTLDCPQNV